MNLDFSTDTLNSPGTLPAGTRWHEPRDPARERADRVLPEIYADLDDEFESIAADEMTPERFAALPALWLSNGFYTLTFPDGSHKTYRIRLERYGARRHQRTLALLIGPDNSTDYEPQGVVTENGFKLWNRFKTGKPAEHAQLLWWLARGEQIEGYELRVSKRCQVCNRPLTTPESLDRGIGPECEKRVS